MIGQTFGELARPAAVVRAGADALSHRVAEDDPQRAVGLNRRAVVLLPRPGVRLDLRLHLAHTG